MLLNTSDVIESEEFLALSHQQVSKLISSDRLTVPSEEKVFECVITWIQHDVEGRHKFISSLMKYVRLPLLTMEYLMHNVEEEPLLKSDLKCKDYLIEALKYHLLKVSMLFCCRLLDVHIMCFYCRKMTRRVVSKHRERNRGNQLGYRKCF